jgi:hypothetical protein
MPNPNDKTQQGGNPKQVPPQQPGRPTQGQQGGQHPTHEGGHQGGSHDK